MAGGDPHHLLASESPPAATFWWNAIPNRYVFTVTTAIVPICWGRGYLMPNTVGHS
jgi:hypothetical protein